MTVVEGARSPVRLTCLLETASFGSSWICPSSSPSCSSRPSAYALRWSWVSCGCSFRCVRNVLAVQTLPSRSFRHGPCGCCGSSDAGAWAVVGPACRNPSSGRPTDGRIASESRSHGGSRKRVDGRRGGMMTINGAPSETRSGGERRAEGRGQKAEGRGQKAEGRGQRQRQKGTMQMADGRSPLVIHLLVVAPGSISPIRSTAPRSTGPRQSPSRWRRSPPALPRRDTTTPPTTSRLPSTEARTSMRRFTSRKDGTRRTRSRWNGSWDRRLLWM